MLDKASVDWAIDFIVEHSDGDLFPQVVEMNAIKSEKDHLSSAIAVSGPA
ncbi:hypothetical protein [Leisingera aquimarina]|nr:hypothetical protein [Leisingera aquimarina]